MMRSELQARAKAVGLGAVLGSAGTELIFSLVAGAALRFGFGVRTLLVAH